MNLEQRVQTLEQEVQLLKAQIQATLLDIQEQMLNNTYPVLRGEEPAKAAAPTPAVPVAAAPPVNSLPVKRIVLADLDPDDDDSDPEPVVAVAPVARRVVHVEEPPQLTRSDWAEWEEDEEEEAAAPVQEKVDAHDWIELENWVSQKVEKLGIKRTRELINLYTQQERFSNQERELLLQFVNVYDGVAKPSTALSLPSENKPMPVRPTIVPQTRAVVDEIRDELRQKRAKASKSKNGGSQPLSEQQELVLRLIAGILSAGDEMPPGSNGHGNY